MTKEAAYYRKIFHQHFPNNNYGNGIEKTVPGGPSIACSTAKAIPTPAAHRERALWKARAKCVFQKKLRAAKNAHILFSRG